MKQKIALATILTFAIVSTLIFMGYSYSQTFNNEGTLEENLVPFRIYGATETEDGTVYVLKVVDSHHVWYSNDQGVTWKSTGNTQNIHGNLYCTSKNTFLALMDNKQIARSTDYGKTWTSVHQLESVEGIWNYDEYENQIYAGVYSFGSTKGHAKVLRSSDDGETWTQLAYWSEYRHCHAIHVNHFNGYIYVALGDGPFALMRSMDNGETWTNLYSATIFTAIMSKGTNNQIYLGTDDQYTRIFRFSDEGQSSISLETVFDYGTSKGKGGALWWLQKVKGKLCFGTVVGGTYGEALFGVSDEGWNNFEVVLKRNNLVPVSYTHLTLPTN